MQHGTAREYAQDIIRDVEAVLTQLARDTGAPVGDLAKRLHVADITLDDKNIDQPGRYGPDYGVARVTPEEKREAEAIRDDVVSDLDFPDFDTVEMAGFDGTLRTQRGSGPEGQFTWEDIEEGLER